MGHVKPAAGQLAAARDASRPATADPAGAAAGLGVAVAAQRVGVTASTLRAWERRYGLAPSARTSGGHRRYSDDDVVRLQRMRQLIDSGMNAGSAATLSTVGTLAQDTGVRSADAVGQFAAAVQMLAPGRIGLAAARLLRERGAVAAWTEVFVPYLQALGQQWERAGGGIESEHVAVAAVQAALRTHTVRHARRGWPVQVVAAAVPGEAHTLPLDALAAALAEAGCGASVLYDVPGPALYAAVQRHPQAVVVLWARGSADVAVVRGVRTLARTVCAAGPGWRRARLPRTVRHVTSLPAAVTAVLAVVASDTDGRRSG